MKVLHDTSDHLVLEDRPLLLAAVLLLAMLVSALVALGIMAEDKMEGIAAALMPAGFAVAFVVFVERVRATFDRSTGQIVIATTSIRRRRTESIPLVRLRAATTQTKRGRSRPGARATTMSRPVLELAQPAEPRPLMQVYTAGPGAAAAAAAINRWLGQTAAA